MEKGSRNRKGEGGEGRGYGEGAVDEGKVESRVAERH